MSYGERSCLMDKAPKNEFGGCAYFSLEKMNCNVDCKYYTSNGLPPDSIPKNLMKKEIKKEIPSIKDIRRMQNKFINKEIK